MTKLDEGEKGAGAGVMNCMGVKIFLGKPNLQGCGVANPATMSNYKYDESQHRDLGLCMGAYLDSYLHRRLDWGYQLYPSRHDRCHQQ